MKTCEETVIKDGQPQMCDRPVDERGYCDRPGDHTDERPLAEVVARAQARSDTDPTWRADYT